MSCGSGSLVRADDLPTLEEQLDELGGDVEAAGIIVDEWLSACKLEADKLDNYAALEARSEARKAEARRLMDRAKVDANKAEHLKARLLQHFIRHGRKTVETRRYRITHAMNGGRLPLLFDAEPAELPGTYRIDDVRSKADTDAIRAALDAGETLPFARYGERGSSIRIR